MHIDKIEIGGFGKIKNREYVFGKGMNLVYGGNEAGKSTVQWFIRAMFYGLKSGRRTSGLPPAQKRFMPWDGTQYKGAVYYTLDDGTSFRAERDFEKNEVKIYDSSFNDISNYFEHGRDKQPLFANTQLGIDETGFVNTVFIGQAEVRPGPDGLANMAARLADMDNTGWDGLMFQRAEAALTDALKNRIGTERSRVQPLDRLEEELGKLEEERAVLIGKREQKESLMAELTKTKHQLTELEKWEQWLSELGKLIELRKNIDQGIKKEARLKEAAAGLEETEERIRSLQVSQNDSREGNEPVIQGTAAERKSDLSLNSGRVSARRHKSMPLSGIIVSVLCFAAALLSCALLAAGLLRGGFDEISRVSYIYLLFAAVFAAAGLYLPGKMRNKTERGEKPESSNASQKTSAPDYGSSLYEKRQALEELRQNQLNSASLISGERFTCAAEVRRALCSVQSENEKLSSTFQRKLEEADRFERPEGSFFSKGELDILVYDTDTAILESKWKTEYENVRRQLVETALRKRYCEGQLDEKTEELDRLQCVEEETVAVKEKITYLRNKASALKMALEVLTEAASEIRRTVEPELNRKMSRIIAGLTGSRYTDLRGGDNLKLRAVMPESGDVKDADVLSGGTADQMYLALRLAMSELITEGSESLPLVMDEVFAQYDDRRTELALKYLKKEYKKRQILIFTCKKREAELAWKIFGDEMNYVELENEIR